MTLKEKVQAEADAMAGYHPEDEVHGNLPETPAEAELRYQSAKDAGEDRRRVEEYVMAAIVVRPLDSVEEVIDYIWGLGDASNKPDGFINRKAYVRMAAERVREIILS